MRRAGGGLKDWMRQDWLALGLSIVLMLVFALTVLVLPWGRDQGIYAFSAWQILDGNVPYSEVFIFKPPGTVIVHVASQLLFGANMVAIRAMDVVLTVATGVCLFAIGRRATGDAWGGAFAAVIYAWSTSNHHYWTQSQTDSWANLPYAASILIVLSCVGQSRWVMRGVLAGVCFGGAFWLKYSTGGLLPFLVLMPILLFGFRNRTAWLTAAGICLGFGLSIVGVLGALWSMGAYDEFWRIQADVVMPYTGATSGGVKRKTLSAFLRGMSAYGAQQLGPWGLGAAAAVFGAFVAWFRGRWADEAAQQVAALAAVAWVSSGLLSGYVQGKFWMYQMLAVLGGGALLTSIGLFRVMSLARGRYALAIAAVWVLALSGGRFPNRHEMLASWFSGQATINELYDQGTYRNGGFSSRQARAVSAWLSKHTPEGERIYVWGYDPMIYVLSNRRPVSRFPYHYPQIVPWAPPEYDDELMAALRASPPKHFVVATKDSVSAVTTLKKHSDQLMNEWDELRLFVQQGYEVTHVVGRYTVYVRKET